MKHLQSLITITTLALLLSACGGGGDKGEQNPSKNSLVNATPKALNQTLTLNEDTNTNLTLKGEDEDNDTLGFKVTKKPTHGKLEGTPPELTYTPNKDYNGVDNFNFIVNDGLEDSSEATITLNINPINDAPIAKDDKAIVDEDTNITINPLSNDSDVDIATNQDKLSITNITTPQNAKAVIKDNKIIYTPNPNYNGSDTITYTIEDKNKTKATATIDITINPINDAPIAKDDNASTEQAKAITIDVLKNDNDVDGDTLTITEVSKPKYGTANIKSNQIVYQPNGTYLGEDSLAYTIQDPYNLTSKATVKVNIMSNKQYMGVVELLDDDKIRDVRYGNLHLYGIIRNDNMKKLDMLKLCSKTKCWSVVDYNHPFTPKHKKQISQNYSTFEIGKITIKDINETIETIEYTYNGKTGALKLKEKLYFAQAVIDVLYLKFDEGIEEYFSTLVPPFDYKLFLYHTNSKYIFSNGIIVEAEKDTVNIPGLFYASFLNQTNSSFSCRVSLVNDSTSNAKDTKKIFDSVSRDNFKTKMPYKLNKKIKIYIPIDLSKISEDELRQNYLLQINGNQYDDYQIEYLNSKQYIFIKTDDSNVYIDFRDKAQWGII